jgi:hypothetical protein
MATHKEGDRVYVVWTETGCRFSGLIDKVNESLLDLHDEGSNSSSSTPTIKFLSSDKKMKSDNKLVYTYDVFYDEMVRGKPCVEKNIHSNRIISLDQLCEENIENEEIMEHISAVKSPPNISTSIFRKSVNDIILWLNDLCYPKNDIQRVESDENYILSAENIELVPKQVLIIHNYLTNNQIAELYNNAPKTLELLTKLLSDHIMNENINFDFENHCLLTCTGTFHEWINNNSEFKIIIENSQASIAAGAILLRIIAYLTSNHLNYSSTIVASEEVIERTIQLSTEFLITNAVAPGVIPGKLIGNSSKNKSKDDIDDISDEDVDMKEHSPTNKNYNDTKSKQKFKINNSNLIALLQHIGKNFIPLLRSYIWSLELFMNHRRQSDRLCICGYELAIIILRTDANSNTKACYIDPGYKSPTDSSLTTLQSAAVMLLRCIFHKYPSHRSPILQELLPLFSQIYSPKIVLKGFSLQSSGNLSRTYTTMAYAALVIMLQSTVSTSGGLAALTSPIKNTNGSINESENDTADVSKLTLVDCRRNSSLFLLELLKRCAHKDTCSDYREVALNILQELISSITCPKLPLVAFLFEQFIRKVLNDFNAYLIAPNIGVNNEKKDVTYITFVMDILSAACIGIRKIDTQSINEIESIKNNIIFSDDVILSCHELIGKLKPSVKQCAEKSYSTIKLKPSPSENESKKKKSKKEVIATETLNVETIQLKKIPYGTSLSLSAQIRATLVAKLYQRQQNTAPIIRIPALNEIIKSCEISDEFVELLPDIEEYDELVFNIACYLESEEILLSNIQFNSDIHSENSVTPKRSYIHDSYDILLANWHLQAINGSKLESSQMIASLLLNSANKSAGSNNFTLLAGGLNGNTKLSLSDVEEFAKRSYLSYEFVESSYRQILTDSTLKNLFNIILSSILVFFADPSPVIRSRLVKTLNVILDSDPNLIKTDEIKNAVTDRFNDISISVREEAVKLVGNFMSKGFDISAGYIDGLLIRLNDKGLSVRKAVVNIFKDILLENPDHVRYNELCIALLDKMSLPKEEDSIKELIKNTFQQLWFTPYKSASGLKRLCSVTSDDPKSGDVSLNSSPKAAHHVLPYEELDHESTSSKNNSPSRDIESNTASRGKSKWRSSSNDSVTRKDVLKNKLIATAGQIVDVVGIYYIENNQWLVNLIREMLHGKPQGGEITSQVKARRQETLQQCENLISTMIELLLGAEEMLNKEKVIAIIATLSIFSEAHPSLIIPHIWTLAPYLKGENGLNGQEEALICLKVTNILSSAVVIEGVSFHTKNEELCNDLTNIALKYGGKSVDAAVSCLAKLCVHHLNDASAILSLANKCFHPIVIIAKAVLNTTPAAPINEKQIAQLQRCLVVLGNVCSHSRKCHSLLLKDMDNDKINNDNLECATKDVRIFDKGLKPKCIYGMAYAAILFALKLPNISIQVRAIQALCGVFIGCPKLMMLAEESGVIGIIFSNEDARLERFLQSLKEMLVVEELRLENGLALSEMKQSGVNLGNKVLGPNEQDADTSVAGFVLSQHMTTLLSLTHHNVASIRFESLELLGTMLRQGVICPLEVIAIFVAMQGDPEQYVRKESLRLLHLEDEKHPIFLDNRVVEGMEMSYLHQIKTMGIAVPIDEIISDDLNNDLQSSTSYSSIFNSIYTTCIQSTRKRRNDFLYGLLKRMEVMLENLRVSTISVKSAGQIWETISFLATTMCHFSFDHYEEPLQLIYWINRNIPLNSSILLTSMRELLLNFGASKRDVAKMQGPAVGSAPGKKDIKDLVIEKQKSSSGWEDGLIFDENILKEKLSANISNKNQSTSDIQLLEKLVIKSAESRGCEALLRVKSYLKTIYSISDEKCQQYSPNDPVTTASVNSDRIKSNDMTINIFSSLPPYVTDSQRNIYNYEPQDYTKDTHSIACSIVHTCLADYNRLTAILESGPEDFVLAKSKKRKNLIEKSNNIDVTKKTKKSIKKGSPPQTKSKKRNKRKLTGTNSSDDEDDGHDDEDEDYLD